jgi:hypothetical protein
MKKHFPFEFIYQVFSLLIIIIVVHAAYVAIIRPNAQAELEQQTAQLKIDKDFVPKRSIYVLIRDYEQEACFILMFWSLFIMAYKGTNLFRERSLLDKDILHAKEGIKFLPQDTHELTRQIQT